MRRPRRILPNVATVLALVACAALTFVWRASYSAEVPLWFNRAFSPMRVLSVERGEVRYGRTISRDAGWEGVFDYDYPFRVRCATLLAVAAALPLSRLALMVARLGRRYYARHFGPRPDRCEKCGYDLRATPDRSPECGAIPTAQAARPGGAAPP